MAFDVGLFDKTDITTLSRVVMSERAYNDQSMRSMRAVFRAATASPKTSKSDPALPQRNIKFVIARSSREARAHWPRGAGSYARYCCRQFL
jgi:hypothetical protein